MLVMIERLVRDEEFEAAELDEGNVAAGQFYFERAAMMGCPEHPIS
jgi:hypothetical protein